jgi:S-(hydroxymethyl)glutathione dehydrogenase/alcohol dehydrogenase
MKAAVLEAFNEPLVIRDVQLSPPGPAEVRVRTSAVSLCHSDLHFMEGTRPLPLPAILGHEVAGIVEEVGRDVKDLAPGDHVVGALGVYCGTCPCCLAGRLTLCSDTSVKQPPGQARRISMEGRHVSQVYNLSAFAEAFVTHRNALVKITNDIPLDRAALLGCGVATGTGAVFRTAAVQPGQDVVVIGVGGVGLSAINGARIAGANRIIAVDRLPEKLAMATTFGATHGIDASSEDVIARVHEITGGGADHAIECVGVAATLQQAFGVIKPAGIATVVGVFPPSLLVPIDANQFLSEKQLRGSMLGSTRIPVDIPKLAQMYLDGRLLLDQMISRRIRLEEINEGFADMKRGHIARCVVVF